MKIEKIKRRNSFISKDKYENRQNCEWCGISNGQTIPKFELKFVNLLIFQFRKFLIWKISQFAKIVIIARLKEFRNF